MTGTLGFLCMVSAASLPLAGTLGGTAAWSEGAVVARRGEALRPGRLAPGRKKDSQKSHDQEPAAEVSAGALPALLRRFVYRYLNCHHFEISILGMLFRLPDRLLSSPWRESAPAAHCCRIPTSGWWEESCGTARSCTATSGS